MFDLAARPGKDLALLLGAPHKCCWIFEVPVSRDRVSWPAGTRFASGLIAYRDHEFHVRSIGDRVFIPALAAEAVDGEAEPFNLFDRKRMHRAARMATCAVGVKPARAGRVENCLGNNAARRVAGAKK